MTRGGGGSRTHQSDRDEGCDTGVPCGRQLRARPGLARPCARSVQLAPPGGAQTARFAPAGTLRCGRPGSLALRHAPTRHPHAAAPVHAPVRTIPGEQRGGWGFTEGRCAEPPKSPERCPGRSRRDAGSLFEPEGRVTRPRVPGATPGRRRRRTTEGKPPLPRAHGLSESSHDRNPRHRPENI